MLEGEPSSASCVQVDPMIRGILQFALLIALCCALHRYGKRKISIVENFSFCFVVFVKKQRQNRFVNKNRNSDFSVPNRTNPLLH